MFCTTPEKSLFKNLSTEEASKLVEIFLCQPSSSWDDVVDSVGWRKVPSTYLVAENDATLDSDLQLQMAEMAGCDVERCNAGHCCMIRQPGRCTEVVRKAVGKVL